jgi:hypothetical protein
MPENLRRLSLEADPTRGDVVPTLLCPFCCIESQKQLTAFETQQFNTRDEEMKHG